ncbi:IS701 family transposase [Actinoplanes sp. RD1]|uniref:IS701 family transposase n=1 Tax=Actinoplanes sp. RD1 TaxID=3064538 RepID=UPI0027417552|nr:IS701 family transposase [Actinoplanes sp. RD1]
MDTFDDFCADVFASLGRTDQRSAAGTYLYGLLSCPGRKSIRRLVETSPGRSEQSLQQFINQSPWDPEPIRRRLFHRLVERVRPAAWVVEEVSFPKHGRWSAAVERQYVPSLGRVCNCQLAITVTLTTADGLTVPVDWRLMIPEAWGRDEDRRAKARMPCEELPRPYWQYQLEALDDMALEWGMPAAPVMVDTANRTSVEPFLAGLEHRHQPYLVHVSPQQRVWFDAPGARPRGPGDGPEAGSGLPWHGTVTDLVTRSRNLPRETVAWSHDGTGVLRSQFLQLPVRAFCSDGVGARPPGPAPQRLLICEWPLGKSRPRGFWLTDMTDRTLPELVELAKTRPLTATRIESFADRYGLRDYEGRTFAGWHHHVTLAGAAYVYDVLAGLRDDPRELSEFAAS